MQTQPETAIPKSLILVYCAAIVGAEGIFVYFDLMLGFIFHSALIFIFIAHYMLPQPTHPKILPILALIPIIRMLSLTLTVQDFPPMSGILIIGIPLLIVIFLLTKLLEYSRLGWITQKRPDQIQLVIGLSGIPLGYVGYALLNNGPLVDQSDMLTTVIGMIIVTLCVGFVEEFIFRGLLLEASIEIFGQAGLLISSLLFATLYLGSLSFPYVIFMGLVGLFFSWCVFRTGSLWGVIIAHTLLSIGQIIVWS